MRGMLEVVRSNEGRVRGDPMFRNVHRNVYARQNGHASPMRRPAARLSFNEAQHGLHRSARGRRSEGPSALFFRDERRQMRLRHGRRVPGTCRAIQPSMRRMRLGMGRPLHRCCMQAGARRNLRVHASDQLLQRRDLPAVSVNGRSSLRVRQECTTRSERHRWLLLRTSSLHARAALPVRSAVTEVRHGPQFPGENVTG